jgi:radical SAM-linked protein
MTESRPEAPPQGSTAEPRQRWRITFARPADPAQTTQRDFAAAWLDGLARAGLPLTGGGRGRQPLSFGAALPVGIAAEREVADILLTDRRRIDQVRTAVESAAPPGVTILELHDVWLGEPPIAAAVGGADYLVTLDSGGEVEELPAAAQRLLAAPAITWRRPRGGGTQTVDLRPLILGIDVVGDTPTRVRMRCRIHPERGSGRPDEIVAALSEVLGRPLAIAWVVRERVLLATEVEAEPDSTAGPGGRPSG